MTRREYADAAGPCNFRLYSGEGRCGALPSSGAHTHAVAWECDASDDESDDHHRYVCRRHGRGGDIDHAGAGFNFSFCGRCTIDRLLADLNQFTSGGTE